MASIRKRGDKWQAQVRRQGASPVARSFLRKSDAEAWARSIELQIDRGDLQPSKMPTPGMSVGDLLMRYMNEVVPSKRGHIRETVAIRVMLKNKLAGIRLAELTSARLAAYRDERLTRLKGSSVNRELAILRHLFEVARRDWDVALPENPVKKISKPRNPEARSRRLEPGEWQALSLACRRSRNPHMVILVEFALETAMRYGELINARWMEVNLAKRTLLISQTKNGTPRVIPLSPRAMEMLQELEKSEPVADSRLFPVTYHSAKMAWRRIQKRSGLKDFRFHDLRHEAISRFFEKGLNIAEVALISGHRDPRILFRYTHPRAELIALKLAA